MPQYEIYLFECILLCCKEINTNKNRDKKDKTKSTGPKAKTKGGPLQLKGRIFMTNVTDVVAISKTGKELIPLLRRRRPGLSDCPQDPTRFRSGGKEIPEWRTS